MINGQGTSVWSPSKIAALRAAKRRPSLYPSINVVPLIAVLLVILFLWIGNPISPHTRAVANIPTAQNSTLQPRALREDAIRITVAIDGRVYFGQTEIRPEDLHEMIRTAIGKGAEKTVYLAADSRTKNADVEAVLDEIRLSGVSNVVILATKPVHP